ncbi:MAG TPA: substrate-binding domain-containing protein [Candidatus Brocadiia bacterium]|nr:substrate-binding domain-containing protein [Candidatus Brocadiia bacterium]
MQAAFGRAQRGVVGVVFGSMPPSSPPSYSSEKTLVLDGIQDALLRLRQSYKAIPVEPWQRLDQMETIRECGVLVFVETFQREQEIEALWRRGVPLVVANLELDLALPCTRVDHEAVGRSAARLLMALGHRRIGMMIRDPNRVFYGRFLRGCQSALEEAGLRAAGETVGVSRDYLDPQEPVKVAREMLSRKPRVTAVACGRDHLAKAVRQAADEMGLALGRDLSVVSYDDCSWAEGQGFLTTFREPCRELGAAAVEMLTECMVYGRVPTEQRTLAAPLVLRRSAGPAFETDSGPLDGGGAVLLDVRP